MPTSLLSRASLILLGLLVALGVVGIVQTVLTTREHMDEVEQKLNRDLAAHLVKDTTILKDGEVQHENLEHVFHILMVINPRIELYLLDRNGKILEFSAAEGKVKRDHVSMEPIHALLNGDPRLPFRGDDPRNPERRKIFSVAPIPSQGQPEGFLYVVLGGEEYDSVVGMVRGSYILRLSAWVAFGSLVIVFLAGLGLFRRLARPLRQLDACIRSYREEHLISGEPVAVEGRDEIQRLDDSFRRMRRRIEEQLGELERADTMRRELVANVSHDLRTPLAALQGYLETLLLRDPALSEEERRRYLDIAFRNSEKLAALVNELFELAKLDSGDTELRLESFSIAELVQDIVEKSRLSGAKDGIEICAELPTDLPLVSGDIGLIERVIDNLLDNALRHSPQGGRVTVGVAGEAGGAEVRVTDSGTGIAPADLPRIFDRFYRGKESGGAGLGLAIAKRIVEMHGSSISVSTTPAGASFFFVLSPHPARAGSLPRTVGNS